MTTARWLLLCVLVYLLSTMTGYVVLEMTSHPGAANGLVEGAIGGPLVVGGIILFFVICG